MNKNSPEDLIIIQITDLHIFTNKEDMFDKVNTYQSLQAIITAIKNDFPDFTMVLVTGDLVQDPESGAYTNMLEILGSVDQPVYYLPGNHDDPELMLNILDTHFRQQIQLDNWGFFFLNSYKPATHSGYLEKKELNTLDSWLAETTDLNTLICLHHHPVSINSEWMDGMMLENPVELFEIIDKYDHVRGIIWGHIHQNFSQIRKNVLLLGTPSTCAQFLPGAKKFEIDTQQPGYRWLKLKNDGNIETGINRLSQETTLSRR